MKDMICGQVTGLSAYLTISGITDELISILIWNNKLQIWKHAYGLRLTGHRRN